MTRRQLIKGACVITVDPVIGTLAHGDILIDGEPAKLGNRAQFTVAECPVDLLASAHGF